MPRIGRFLASATLALSGLVLASGTASAQHHHGGHSFGFGLGYGHHYSFYGLGYGYGHGYGYGYPYGGYGYYPPYYYGYSASVRVQAEPSTTRVFVDGYYVGVVDDFDGVFQRLHLAPGRHEIALRLEGYKTHRFRLYAAPGHTVKIHHDMTQGTGEDESDHLAGGPPYREETRLRGQREDSADRDVDRADRGPAAPFERQRTGRQSAERGEVRMTVWPAEASVYMDGEFRGSSQQVSSLDLSPGRHRLEVVRPGFRTFEQEVEVEAGRTLDLDVELEPADR